MATDDTNKNPKKSPAVICQDSVADMSIELDKSEQSINRIATNGCRDATDFALMMSCTRFVAARQIARRVLEER